jgi:AraC family transcriptional regulator, transcriptional activator of pobA
MKDQDTGVFTYTISEVYADAGKKSVNPDFFVISSDELREERKMTRPVRSRHFTFILLLIDYILCPNSVFIIPPLLVHEFVERSADASIMAMGFSNEFLGNVGLPKKHVDAFTFLASQNNPHTVLQKEEVEILRSCMLLLKQKNSTPDEHPFKKDILNASFLMYMLEMAGIYMRHRPREKLKLTRKEDLTMSFIKLLTIHFKEERSVQFYAEALFVTPKHLTKTVKELTGRTCGEFIDEMVITEAKILLNDLNLSIGNVADELHFSDQFFFSKYFKNHTGLTPTEYKINS